MTLLTHDIGSPYPARQDHTAGRVSVQPGASRETTMRVFFRAAVTLFLSAAALAAIIALKTAIFLPHFNS